MLLVNDRDRGLFNGSRGVVERFDYHETQNPRMRTPAAVFSRITDEEYSKFARGNPGETAAKHAGGPGRIPIPVVRFLARNQLLHVGPDMREIETRLSNGCQLVLQRLQLPLALAWASTIHRSQGQTLDYARTDIEGCFQPGQSYVALSRGIEPDNLRIVGGDRGELQGVCMVAPSVLKYYGGLEMWMRRTL